MALHTTLWRPDTCECVLLYTWDDAVPVEARVHTPIAQTVDATGTTRLRHRCAAHTAHEDVQQHYDAVLKESRVKNLRAQD